MTNQPTTVTTTEVDIDSFLNLGASGENITTQNPSDKAPSLFANPNSDLSFLDKPAAAKAPETPKAEGAPLEETKPAEQTQETLDKLLNPESTETEEQPAADEIKGRPKTDKSGLVEIFGKLIESEKLFGFDDNKPLEEFTQKDFIDLVEMNLAEREKELQEKIPQEFFESLPQELKYAAKYVADGGTDIKGLFKALSHVEEVRSLDPTIPQDQEQIIRSYLQAKEIPEDQINEDIETYKDLGKLKSKAEAFKPILDKMQEQVIQQQLAQQEQIKIQQKQIADAYIDDVYNALKTAEINSIKLDKKTQSALYAGLTQVQYPSRSGKQTNHFGHLIEKYQMTEKNYPLLAEAYWLLSNPEGYRAAIKAEGKNQATEETVRSLKTAQASKIANNSNESEQKPGPRKLSRSQNIFSRT